MYYFIQHPTDLKIIGNQPQIEQLIYSESAIQESVKLMNHFELPLNPEIKLPLVRLHKKAKPTDHIFGYYGELIFKLIVSQSFIQILQKFNFARFLKLPIDVEIRKENKATYYLISISEPSHELIDFAKSNIFLRKLSENGSSQFEPILFENVSAFLNDINKLEGKITLRNLAIKEDCNLDFFLIRYVEGGAKYVVSERLKSALLEAGITGIEFQPTHYSLNEWYASEERKRIYGKIM